MQKRKGDKIMKKRVAIFPGTFDPITLGHYDLIKRSSFLFDKTYIAVAKSSGKQPLLSLSERLRLVSDVVNDLSDVEVISFDGLTVNLAVEKGANVIVRGLRSAGDVDHEFQLAHMNAAMNSSIETVFLMSKSEYSHISSTIVREIIRMGGDVSSFVPKSVLRTLSKYNALG